MPQDAERVPAVATPQASGPKASSPPQQVAAPAVRPTLELTDGWYAVTASLDAAMAKRVRSGKVFVGQKLRICMAQLEGLDDGVEPLECACNAADGAAHPRLALHANGTRRARYASVVMWMSLLCAGLTGAVLGACATRWDAKLGFQRARYFRVSLKSIVPDGGIVPCIKVVIARKYQTRFVVAGATANVLARVGPG